MDISETCSYLKTMLIACTSLTQISTTAQCTSIKVPNLENKDITHKTVVSGYAEIAEACKR